MFWTKGKLSPVLSALALIATLTGVCLGQEQMPRDGMQRGVVAIVGDPYKDGLKVQCAREAICYPTLLYFDKDTAIVLANGKKATVADLKPGRWISFKTSANLEPMGISRAKVERVVLDEPDDGKLPHQALAVSRDRKRLAAVVTTLGVAPPIIRVVLVDARTGKVTRELECDTNPIYKLAFSPDGKLLFGGVDPFNSGDPFFHGIGRLFVWEVATGKCVKELTSGCWTLSPDGKHLATVLNFVDRDPGSEGRQALPPNFTVQILDTTTWKQVARRHEENSRIAALCFSPDGKRLALSVMPYDIRLWDWREGKDRQRIEPPKWKEETQKMWGAGWIPYLEFSPDGALLASMTDLLPEYYETPRNIDLWDVSTGKLVRSLSVGQYRPLYLTFTPRGNRIAMIGDQGKFRLIDAVSGKTAKEFKCQVGTWIGLAPALYSNGLAPEQAINAAPVFQVLWDLTGGAGK